MRQKRNRQRSIFEVIGKHPGPKELEQMSLVLDANPEIDDLAFADLTKGKRTDTGRKGMTAEQVLRCAILKQVRDLTYDDLEYWLADSKKNIKSLCEETWMAIHQFIISYADDEKLEKGRKIRLDSTVVESNIHSPSDSALLWDGVRVITRYMFDGKNLSPQPGYSFSDHRRVVKKRLFTIQNTKSKKVREAAYKDMLRYAYKVCVYGESAVAELYAYEGGEELLDVIKARNLAESIAEAINLLRKVIDQTERRVLIK